MTTSAKFAFPRRGRSLQPGQLSELTIINSDGGDRTVIFTADEIIEAPNWTVDGLWLIFNAGGELFRISPQGDTPERIDTGELNALNNDHVLSPDGKTIYASNGDGHLYALPIAGGTPQRVSNVHATPFRYYLHGISPDGKTLAYVGVEGSGDQIRANIFTIPAAGGPDTRLTDTSAPTDGPEYSPDGEWIYYNSEEASLGHAQIFRRRADGSSPQQLTFDERVNWFPHFSPDGTSVAYLAYPAGTRGHPADKDVILRIMSPDGQGMRDLAHFFGGQGTINVNSWAPDSKRLAYVAYPLAR
jgi:Tol biopolymer transport system component